MTNSTPNSFWVLWTRFHWTWRLTLVLPRNKELFLRFPVKNECVPVWSNFELIHASSSVLQHKPWLCLTFDPAYVQNCLFSQFIWILIHYSLPSILLLTHVIDWSVIISEEISCSGKRQKLYKPKIRRMSRTRLQDYWDFFTNMTMLLNNNWRTRKLHECNPTILAPNVFRQFWFSVHDNDLVTCSTFALFIVR